MPTASSPRPHAAHHAPLLIGRPSKRAAVLVRLERGEPVAVGGSRGCGKTVLMREVGAGVPPELACVSVDVSRDMSWAGAERLAEEAAAALVGELTGAEEHVRRAFAAWSAAVIRRDPVTHR